MSDTKQAIHLIKTLSTSQGYDTETGLMIEELNRWLTAQLESGSNDVLFRAGSLLSKELRSSLATFVRFNINFRQTDGMQAFVFGIPIFFPRMVPYSRLKELESAIAIECLTGIMTPSLFPAGSSVSVLDYLSEIPKPQAAIPSALHSLSSFLISSLKFFDRELTEADQDASPFDPVTKGFRVLHDTNRCLLLGSVFWNVYQTDFGLDATEIKQFKQGAKSSGKYIASVLSKSLGIPCQVSGLMPLTNAVAETIKGHYRH